MPQLLFIFNNLPEKGVKDNDTGEYLRVPDII